MRDLIFAACLCAACLPGQWRPLSPTQAPTPRQGHAMVHDPGSGNTWLFGGRDTQGPRGDTWRWNGRDWRPGSMTGGPSPRSGHGMAWDSARDVAVLFGGDPLSAETWEFDGVNWTRRRPSNAPLPRHSHVLAYDEARQRTVLFGGFAGNTALGDTWEWDGVAWTRVSTTNAPSPRGASAAAYDPRLQGIVLFGGADAPGGNRLGETWIYDGTDWQLDVFTGPAPRAGAAMADDRNGRHVLMFGGDDGAASNETWMWFGGPWMRRQILAPSGRHGHAMAHDRARGLTLLFGGSTGGGETWRHVRPFQGSLAPQAFFETFGNGCGPQGPVMLPSPATALPLLGNTFTLATFPTSPFGLFVGVLGFSSNFSRGAPLPRPIPGLPSTCMQYVDPAFLTVLPQQTPLTTWSLPVPNLASLAGQGFYLQAIQFNTSTLAPYNATNAGEGILGLDVRLREITETFDDDGQRDSEVSSGAWGGGVLLPGLIGGDGRHGSFDPAVGTRVAPGVFELDTDNTVIPANRTLTARAETITDGRFSFSDLVIPAGTTVRFTGSSPLVLRVRGNARIDGIVQANGETMTGFRARDRFSSALLRGQTGGLGGPGGGRGGKGGDRCSGNGPRIVIGVNTNDGQSGEDLRLPAGHAYAGLQAGTGGRGSGLFPASGLNSAVVYRVSFGAFSGMIGAGGGGGGYSSPGAAGMAVSSPSPPPNAGELGPSSVGGGVLSPFPLPAGTSSLDHFLIGGSGGGGGGSHPFLAVILAFPDTWKAGAGGSGGGGAVALRAGNNVLVGGTVEARGGDGFLFSDLNMGIPAPGGGGSGGTVLLQAGRSLVVQGTVDTSGGPGSSTGNIQPVNLNGVSQGGAGSPGLVRVESGSTSSLASTSTIVPPPGPNSLGVLQDRDALVGARSLWYSTQRQGVVPSYLRFELDVTVNGVPVTFSDDPTFGYPANQPGLPVRIRFQGTGPDLQGNPDPQRAGPWRDSVVMLPVDRAVFFRFDIVFDKSVAQSVDVTEVRVVVR